ncbi:Phytochelatin synthase-domain-containing protein [Peziza echinospora]|nr:Phytochelatin synthase-domain-containing protein [Peziza echinospora]
MDNSFYMRELPASADLIPYDSVEGKKIFRNALEEGGLEAFFPLSQQFLTQEEPAYCGIGTLCMILNALKVDPAKTWRRPWRWFTQEMLDCCRPLDYVRTNGITLNEFTCLARCNGLEANTKYADKISLEDFRKDVIASTTTSSQIMAVSYSRSALGQTGSGHFSPVGGYSSLGGGKVLILDVARFKYPSYWVSLRALYESLIPVDPATKQPRGYSLLKKPPKEVADSTHLLRLGFTKSTWPKFFAGCKEVVEGLEREHGDNLTIEILTQGLGRFAAEKQAEGFMPVRTRREATSLNGAVDKSVAISPPANTITSIAFDTLKVIPTAQEYTHALKTFLTHLSSNSHLYNLLPQATTPKETQISTILLLAMYSFSPFLRLLPPALKTEMEGFVARDLVDEEIRREVSGVRRQMASLETCCVEECGDACANGGCAGKMTS